MSKEFKRITGTVIFITVSVVLLLAITIANTSAEQINSNMVKVTENNFSRVIYHNTKEFKNNNMDKESLSNPMINFINNSNMAQRKY